MEKKTKEKSKKKKKLMDMDKDGGEPRHFGEGAPR